jgi:lysophospholipase L1-like esterase
MINLEHIKSQLQQNGKYWIVFTGDSITSCEWVHPNWRDIVIYVLQNELTTLLNGDWKTAEWGIKGFNFAYDGATTQDILERLGEVTLLKPQLVIGLMGGNDPTLGISVENHVENIKNIINKVTSNDMDLIWCNSTPAGNGSRKNKEYEPYAKAFMGISDSKYFSKIDIYHLYNKFPTERFFTFISEENPIEGIKAGDMDLQHPNQLGNAYIAKIILKEVFNIEFDPEKYIQDTLSGVNLPDY